MNPSSFASVPQVVDRVNLPVVETINICPECWLDTRAVMVFMGRELCPDCARSEEAAFDQAQVSAWEEMEFGRHDQMSSLGSVLAGMGF